MIKSKLLIREKIPGKKQQRILITSEGRDRIRKATAESLAAVFSFLSQDEKQALAEYLYVLRKKAKDLMGISYQPPFIQAMFNSGGIKPNGWNINNEPVSDYNLWVFLDGTGFAMSRLRQLELARFNVSVEQYMILTILAQSGFSVKAREIEDCIFRQPNSVSTIISRMIKNGLVVREKRRFGKSSDIVITERGKSLLNQITDVAIELAFSDLKKSEKMRLYRCLNATLSNARNLLGMCNEPAVFGRSV